MLRSSCAVFTVHPQDLSALMDKWPSEKYGMCEMKGCKVDGWPPQRQLLVWFKGVGKKSQGKYRCPSCLKSAKEMSNLTTWRNSDDQQEAPDEEPQVMQIYVKAGDRTIAVDVTEGCTIDVDEMLNPGHSGPSRPRSRSRGRTRSESRGRTRSRSRGR